MSAADGNSEELKASNSSQGTVGVVDDPIQVPRIQIDEPSHQSEKVDENKSYNGSANDSDASYRKKVVKQKGKNRKQLKKKISKNRNASNSSINKSPRHLAGDGDRSTFAKKHKRAQREQNFQNYHENGIEVDPNMKASMGLTGTI